MRPLQAWSKALGVMCFLVLMLSSPVLAQHADHGHLPGPHHGLSQPDGIGGAGDRWEGSRDGRAYSEFNHHLAGVFVLLIGLSEFRHAMAATAFARIRFLLPLAMLGFGGFLMIWSDHDAWPIGSLSFVQTFLGGDWEIIQHKLYAVLLLVVGLIELVRRTGRVDRGASRIPLPVFAILGGLTLFVHSHGIHPAAQKITMHHTIMGILAITAGACKLISGWATRPMTATPVRSPQPDEGRFGWGLAWASLILIIGFQLLAYTE